MDLFEEVTIQSVLVEKFVFPAATMCSDWLFQGLKDWVLKVLNVFANIWIQDTDCGFEMRSNLCDVDNLT